MKDTAVRPEDALYLQLDMLLQLRQPQSDEVITGTLGPMWQRALGATGMQSMPHAIRQHVQSAATYHVSDDMVSLIEHAALKLANDDEYRVESAPTEFGFAILDRPLVVHDVWHNPMLVHAVAWGPMKVIRVRDEGDSRQYAETGVIEREALTREGNSVGDATLFIMWNDVVREPDFYARKTLDIVGLRRYREKFGRWSLIGAELLKDGQCAGPRMIDPKLIDRDLKYDGDDGRAPQPFVNSFRYTMAMFELMNQTVVSTQRRPGAKTTQRRATRERMLSTEVSVVTLRRRSVPDPDRERETRHVNWSRRWVVDGHWHRYRVGVGRRDIRRVWVDSYVKGPDDKPLITPRKIYDLRR